MFPHNYLEFLHHAVCPKCKSRMYIDKSDEGIREVECSVLACAYRFQINVVTVVRSPAEVRKEDL